MRDAVNRGGVLVVTTDQLPGHVIRAVYGEVLGLSARTLSAYSEGFKSPMDGSGVSMAERIHMLTECRLEAVDRMARVALRLGANAVLAMRFDHRPVTESWIEICAYGTAVQAEVARLPRPRKPATPATEADMSIKSA
ncbi:heavy metal-binding domain-containing protein [Catellatospora sichuanensis]|uniref:heavy metal-binding domain-containing protein n=1 Tax=Catellatospora sichuanensis TaxID=1969805 RepID=UPI0011844391|nr:heavy metal-binding domain-containing protein [Catellatospora sichuanensis]